ncbi:TetR/AcrR family transcriptional regulator [Micavibrio aeruginosavorus]|uniref:TetR/AcrR family transcriptional regulator n=1 Tax=Micavibrio aeruginosavorus TaxID=349221 RepID=UPI003F4ACCDF
MAETACAAVTEFNPKRDAIMAAAARLFLERGYSGTSMEAIAEAAPVSKPTLYTHFRDKNDLFAAVVMQRCEAFLSDVEGFLDHSHDPDQALRPLASKFVEMIHDEEALAVHRIVIFEWRQFPELGERFYSCGPHRTITMLASYLRAQSDRKLMHVPKPEDAAALFFSMLKGDLHMRCLLGLHGPLTPAARDAIVDMVVPVFIRGFSNV